MLLWMSGGMEERGEAHAASAAHRRNSSSSQGNNRVVVAVAATMAAVAVAAAMATGTEAEEKSGVRVIGCSFIISCLCGHIFFTSV